MNKIIIAGGRNYQDYETVKRETTRFLSEQEWESAVVVSGGASGADALGERFAKEMGFPMERYPADWKQHGRAAGPIRNKQMAENADALLAFWDGVSRGTKSMIALATKHGLIVKVVQIGEALP